MKDSLADVKQKIQTGVYKNEEHVRLSLVSRILLELGWNLWDPREVNTELIVSPAEDKTKVDIALFTNQNFPCVFIEIKAVGGITGRLSEIERQLRDYNRNNTALFSVITDGKEWRFYYSQTGGEFSQKCFKIIDILEDDLDGVAKSLFTLLSKSEIDNGNAKMEAENYLRLSQKQRAMEDSLPHARRLVQEPPYPSLPECLQNLVRQKDFQVTLEEAVAYIKNSTDKKPLPMGGFSSSSIVPTSLSPSSAGSRRLNSDNPESVKFTKILEAAFGEERVTGWNSLLEAGIHLALGKGVTLNELQSSLSTKLKDGHHNQEGYHPIDGTNVSMQGMNADNSLKNAIVLAKKLHVKLLVRFLWEKGTHMNQEGFIDMKP
ncbi:MAG: hypothetical protein HW390_3211 [Candidatus Brocadiaceae bacterium]|nr:hypothetical protein [Candidatus Brocadiaceae bacterium]